MPNQREELVFAPLGGVGEIGMNLALYGMGPERNRRWIVVDFGVAFAGDDLPGIDLIMPDIAYLVEERRNIAGIVLTHAHWDHVSGLPDLAGAPVWVNRAERDFIRDGGLASALIRGFGDLPYHVYDFEGGPYLGFERSEDVFGDGSIVLVPAPGHTPGSIIAFLALPSGQRFALVGDLVWQKEGIELPAERPWLSRSLADADPAGVRRWIVLMHQIQRAMPDLVIVPAHDSRVLARLPTFPDSIG
jgi:glyoxylase-like metal-dependent hydrolase (beta-lactamase superfamily II)